jgi:hypothetical protein
MNFDERIRMATFQWLKEQAAFHGDVPPCVLLMQGFPLEGQRIPLLSPQSIFSPGTGFALLVLLMRLHPDVSLWRNQR